MAKMTTKKERFLSRKNAQKTTRKRGIFLRLGFISIDKHGR
jgi:hypothetical protein